MLAEWRRTATGAGVAMLALTSFLGWFISRAVGEHARREYERESRIRAERLEALGKLTGGITHDFANFLHIVAANVTLIRERPPWPMIDAALANIERAVRGGTTLTERLLSFARKGPLKVEPLELDNWLEDARPLLTQAAGSGVTIDVEARQPMPQILCDPGQLDMALVNLIVNARDAMQGSGCVVLRAFPCRESGLAAPEADADAPHFVCLTVQDNGSGMSEEAKTRALEPFYTTKGDGGTGLGLPQVYGFMRQLGGSMSIESRAGRGTAVHLFFPVAPVEIPRQGSRSNAVAAYSPMSASNRGEEQTP
jgi:signal transduction histidine kinase